MCICIYIQYRCVCYVFHLPHHQTTLFPWATPDHANARKTLAWYRNERDWFRMGVVAKLVVSELKFHPKNIASSHWKNDFPMGWNGVAHCQTRNMLVVYPNDIP